MTSTELLSSCCAFCFPSLLQDSNTSCHACDVDNASDLWMCITCGNVGCGRYTDGHHAVKHYQQTHHTYSMNLETRQVWDYAGDGFVHRLLFRTDGKVCVVTVHSACVCDMVGGFEGGGSASGILHDDRNCVGQTTPWHATQCFAGIFTSHHTQSLGMIGIDTLAHTHADTRTCR